MKVYKASGFTNKETTWADFYSDDASLPLITVYTIKDEELPESLMPNAGSKYVTRLDPANPDEGTCAVWDVVVPSFTLEHICNGISIALDCEPDEISLDLSQPS